LAIDGGGVIVVNNYAKTVVRIEPEGVVVALAAGADGPRHPPVAFGSVWLVMGNAGPRIDVDGAEYTQDAIARTDPTTGAVQVLIPAGAQHLVATDDAIWGAGRLGPREGVVWTIDPATDQATLVAELGGPVVGMAPVGDRIWVAMNCLEMPCSAGAVRLASISSESAEVSRISDSVPADLYLTEIVATPQGMALIGSPLESIVGPGTSQLILCDESGRARSTIDLGVSASGAALSDDGLWISSCFQGTVSLLDPATGMRRADPVAVGIAYPEGEPFDPYREDPYYACPSTMAAASDVLWVANAQQDTVVAVRPTPQ
jgi:hypothetical protein